MMSYSSNKQDVIVIGGGISGLATAWYLAKSGLSVQVWEKSHHCGGKIKTDNINGFQTEQAASMVMNFKPEVDNFFNETGLQSLKSQRLLNSESQRYLIQQGKLQALPMTIHKLFLSSLWSHSGKLKLLMEPFISKGSNPNESVSEFITRRFGSEFLEKAMEPFISGTLASDPDKACARYVIPRLTALERKYGSITAGIIMHKILRKRTARNPESFSFQQGMQTITQQLADDPELGLQANYQVEKIIRHNTKNGQRHWEVQAQTPYGDIQCKAHHVVIASPAENAAQLIEPLNHQLGDLLSSIEYAPLSVVHLGFEKSAIKHPLNSAGFLVPRQEKMSINGNLWMSSLFADKAPQNHVLLSSYLGGARHPEMIHLSEQESVDEVLKNIKPLLGIHSSPVMAKVNKHYQALPLYHGNYHQKLTAIEEQLKTLSGIHLEANYKGGVSIRDRIVSAKNTAENIIQQCSVEHQSTSASLFNPLSLNPIIEKPA